MKKREKLIILLLILLDIPLFLISALLLFKNLNLIDPPINVYIQQGFPLYNQYMHYFKRNSSKYSIQSDISTADISISNSDCNSKDVIYNRIFVLVGDFKILNNDITSKSLQSLVNGNKNIAIETSIASYYPEVTNITSDPLGFIEKSQSNFAIIPFEDLNNKYRTFSIDSNTPLEKKFNEEIYPLKTEYCINKGAPPDLAAFISKNKFINYDLNNINRIIITGTTALGRGEYFRIKQYGTDYPALYVANIMRDAEITHVSDEVSYLPNCTQQVGTLQFCALPYFINTLKYAGVNLVELTGNHNNDFGSLYSLSSITLYDQNNIKHFGGGINNVDARKPAIIKLGNTTFAFLGYNQPGPSYAFATASTSGAAKLDISNMIEDIQNAKKVADIVFVDVQWENENNQFPSQSQINISRTAINAGANIVTGSQAHRPEGMEFYNNGTIMYGLGNLLFDQMENLDTRQGVIVKHTFYNSKLVSTQLIPTLLYNYSQPKPLSDGPDAQAILNQIWQASTNVF